MSLKQKVGAGVARIIAFVNQKGGVGKTTSAVNLTAALHAAGRRVLLCDFDPQANATSGLGVDKGSVRISTYDLAVNEQEAKDAVVHTKFGDLLPSNPALSGAGVELVGIDDREHVLKRALDPLRPEYDYIFIDCSPSLGYTTVNILTAADTVLIPVQCEYLALEGLSKLLNTIRKVKSGLNPALDIEGFLLTMYMRNRLNNQVVNEVREHFGPLAYDTIIQRNIRLGEAPSHGKPVMLYDAGAVGSENYLTLAREFLKRNRKRSK